MSEKIKEHHVSRAALLYVRQSSSFQVTHNEESKRLQYGMEKRLRDLGWKDVEVIDEDLGKSASGKVERQGFQRMVAEVCLGNVGVVAAREMSRFARNSRDWQQLMEVCRVVDTLLMDQETVYDTRLSNDRLLLGLKGSLNEYELDLLRQRSLEARRAKANRGDLLIKVPVGYRKTKDQRFEKDPDQRAVQAVNLVFKKFLELGTVRQTMFWFIGQNLTLPTVDLEFPDGPLTWKRPTFAAVLHILKHPAYAGAYCYGRTAAVHALPESGFSKRRVVRKRRPEWSVLIKDHHEAYISWEQFERIEEMIANNSQLFRDVALGAPKRGEALLTGLVRCKRCGRKLMVRYTGRDHDQLRYHCVRGYLDQGVDKCISIGGGQLDDAISEEIVRALQPGVVEAAALAGRQHAARQDQVSDSLQLELQAAQYEAKRAERQFNAADPENRLVVDELERRWNLALHRTEEIGARLEASQTERESIPTQEIETLATLPEEFKVVWEGNNADVRLKKRIIRALVQEIVVDVDTALAEVVTLIHWKGGVHTELRIKRRRKGENRVHQASAELAETIRELALVCPDKMLAGYLNRNGIRTGFGNRWVQGNVTSFRCKRGIPVASTQVEKGWMALNRAAEYLQMTPKTLRRAAEAGKVPAKHPLADGPWIFRRSDLDQWKEKAEQLKNAGTGDPTGPTGKQGSFDFSTT